MAVTNRQIIDYLLANPNLSDAQIVSTMEQFKISPAQLASAVNLPEGQIAARVGATLPPNQAVLLGDTYVQAVNPIQGSGENEQVGALENVITYKESENKPGGNIQYYSPTGEYQQTTQQQKVDTSFGGAIKDIVSNPGFKIIAAAYGLDAALGMFGGVGTTGAGLEFAGSGGAFDLANAGIAGGAASFTPAQLALIEAGASAAEVAAAGTSAGLLTGGKTAAEIAADKVVTDAAVTNTAGGTGLKVGTTGLDTITANNAGLNTLKVAGDGLLTTTVGTTLAGLDTGVTAAQAAAAAKIASDAALAKKILDTGNTITSGLKTVGGFLQTEEDKAAAKLAADKVTAATQAGVEGSQFRPVGMTTRFGTSNYTYDPVTGRMTSAGYQLSPEAKNAQDRLVRLAESGLQQAEGAQRQFAPLQTGAQNLFSLGNQYISQSPQDVAQNYLNQQMQLLQPGRELELANLQNKLYQQGRTGVSVAQGGTMGATTPELQALFNARAQQEAVLAANAQKEGQANVLFGAGLLDRGATSMGNYYTGQTQAYSPFTTPLTQIQALETAAQQPLTMGANLAQQASTAGFNAGRLGLQGADSAAALTTGRAATTNPYASLFSGFDPAFAQGIAKQIWGG
jgi:hypothetical protein